MSDFDSLWRQRFERFARTYEDEARISGWSETGLRRRVERFASLLPDLGIPERASVMDLGCGAGTYVRLMAGLGYRAVGLDYSVPSLGRARAADPGGKGRYVAGEGYALPVRSESLDLVSCIGVLQAIADPGRLIAEIARILKPGGHLVVEALNGRALLARAQRLRDTLRRLPPRVCTDDPAAVGRWLSARGLEVIARPGLCLPPRQLPRVAQVLADPRLLARIERRPRLAHLFAHSFFFVCRRVPDGAGPHAGARPGPVRA